jgi:chromosome condensin MukBEF complex kleisin-like MukF subunit
VSELERLDELIVALQAPLTDADRDAGWTDEIRERWLAYADGLRDGLRTATDPDPSGAAAHWLRWLDLDVQPGPSPLVGLFASAQQELKRFREHHAGS